MVAFLQDLYGPYPFETVGAIVDDAPDLGYALKTQTKPVTAAQVAAAYRTGGRR